jgi:hypothetical protein
MERRSEEGSQDKVRSKDLRRWSRLPGSDSDCKPPWQGPLDRRVDFHDAKTLSRPGAMSRYVPVTISRRRNEGGAIE